MSDEGRVMPTEAAINVAPKEVTPPTGKGALGRWRTPYRNTVWTQSQVAVLTSLGVEPEV